MIRIKKIMTSVGYNNIFTRLVKINNLRDFVQQSVQYVDFEQEEVREYLMEMNVYVCKNDINEKNSTKKDKMVRYSFSFKNSICQYLERDYRFIKHYYDLLIKKFPERQ